MIRKQMKEMNSDPATKKDYLSEKLPEPKLPALESPWFQAEINRVVDAKKKRELDDTEMTSPKNSYMQAVNNPDSESVSAYETALGQA